MAGLFSGSQRLTRPAPVTTYPFTVGLWVNPINAGVNATFFSLADTATTTNYWSLRQDTGGTWGLRQTDDATPLDITIGTVTANQWAFIVGRFISATNRRLAVLQYNGPTAHGQNTTSDTPAGVDTMALGALNHSAPADFFSGRLAEFWIANIDIQADGAQLQDTTLRQLAYGGPFSLPYIAKNIKEYRSLWSALENDKPEESYVGAGFVPTTPWVNVSATKPGSHVPLPPTYRRPRDVKGVSII